MSTFTLEYTIPAGATLDTDYPIVDIGALTVVAFLPPPETLDSKNIFFTSTLETGVYRPLAPNGQAFNIGSTPGEVLVFTLTQARYFRALQRFIVKTGTVETQDRMFTLILRPVA